MFAYLLSFVGRTFLAGITIFLPLVTRTEPAPTLPPGPLHFVATYGSDANPGTIDAPFRTISRAIRETQPGHTILVRGGVYNELVIINRSGYDGSPITIRNYPNETPVIDGSMRVANWQWYSGNVWRTQFTHYPRQASDGWAVDAAPESSAPDGWASSGDRRGFVSVDATPTRDYWLMPVSIIGGSAEFAPGNIPPGTWASDVLPPPGQTYASTTNWVYINLAHLSDSNPNHHTIRIAGYPIGAVFADNAAYVTLQGFKFQYQLNGISADSPRPHHIIVANNDMTMTKLRTIETQWGDNYWTVAYNYLHDNEYTGIHMEADNSLVQGNIIAGTIAPWSVWGSGGIGVLGNNITVRSNIIERMWKNASNGHGGHGIYVEAFCNVPGHAESAKSAVIDGNAIRSNGSDGIQISGADNARITNNLIYDNGNNGIRVEFAGGGGTTQQMQPTGNQIYNNTLFNNGISGICLESQARATAFRNNIVYRNAVSPISDSSPDLWQEHNLTSDPLFLNEGARDLRLQWNSPAVNRGAPDGAPPVDFAGVPRPQGGAFDIGAYER